MLEKNPNLRFKAQIWADDSVVTFLDKRLSIIDSWSGYRVSDEIVLDCFKLHYNWQLVREPVPVWEAIKALSEGKTIICECAEPYNSTVDKFKITKDSLDNFAFHAKLLFKSTWYIEDSADE